MREAFVGVGQGGRNLALAVMEEWAPAPGDEVQVTLADLADAETLRGSLQAARNRSPAVARLLASADVVPAPPRAPRSARLWFEGRHWAREMFPQGLPAAKGADIAHLFASAAGGTGAGALFPLTESALDSGARVVLAHLALAAPPSGAVAVEDVNAALALSATWEADATLLLDAGHLQDLVKSEHPHLAFLKGMTPNGAVNAIAARALGAVKHAARGSEWGMHPRDWRSNPHAEAASLVVPAVAEIPLSGLDRLNLNAWVALTAAGCAACRAPVETARKVLAVVQMPVTAKRPPGVTTAEEIQAYVKRHFALKAYDVEVRIAYTQRLQDAFRVTVLLFDPEVPRLAYLARKLEAYAGSEDLAADLERSVAWQLPEEARAKLVEDLHAQHALALERLKTRVGAARE